MRPDISEFVDIYYRFADKNINTIAVSTSDERIALTLEYSFERPRDGKLIWPKIIVSAPTLLEALHQAEGTIDNIRGY